MSIFRLQEHTPDVYPRKSRDFQLLCNVFDCVLDGVKFDIDSITDIVDTQAMNERLIPLLQDKLGFFTDKHFTNEQLRVVLQGFMSAVRDKGSRRGISKAIQLFLKVNNISRGSQLTITNVSGTVAGNYVIDIGVESQLVDTTLLTEILRYILPAGYRLEYSFYTSADFITNIVSSDTVNIVIVEKSFNDGVRLSDASIFPEYANKEYPDLLFTGANYVLLSSVPADWSDRYMTYFFFDGIQYVPVSGVMGNPQYKENTYYYEDPTADTGYILIEDEKNYSDDRTVYTKNDKGEFVVEAKVEKAPEYKKNTYYSEQCSNKSVNGVSTVATFPSDTRIDADASDLK